jgi:predicted regulator of Ras-like GTPase activity (Roadblock/LC7/MglB family)
VTARKRGSVRNSATAHRTSADRGNQARTTRPRPSGTANGRNITALRRDVPGVDHCLQEAMAIPGAIGASIVDYTTGFPVASTGAAPNSDHEAAAAGTADVVQAANSRSLFVSAVPHDLLEDLIITTAGAYHLLRLVQTDFDSRLVLYVWLDRIRGNLAVARRRMQTLADELVTG